MTVNFSLQPLVGGFTKLVDGIPLMTRTGK